MSSDNKKKTNNICIFFSNLIFIRIGINYELFISISNSGVSISPVSSGCNTPPPSLPSSLPPSNHERHLSSVGASGGGNGGSTSKWRTNSKDKMAAPGNFTKSPPPTSPEGYPCGRRGSRDLDTMLRERIDTTTTSTTAAAAVPGNYSSPQSMFSLQHQTQISPQQAGRMFGRLSADHSASLSFAKEDACDKRVFHSLQSLRLSDKKSEEQRCRRQSSFLKMRSFLSGDLEAATQSASGDLEAASQSSSPPLKAASQSSSGDLEAASQPSSGDLEAASQSSSQDLKAASQFSSGDLEVASQSSVSPLRTYPNSVGLLTSTLNLPSTPQPSENLPSTPLPSVNPPSTPQPSVNLPSTPQPSVNLPSTPQPSVNLLSTPPPLVNLPSTPSPSINLPFIPPPPKGLPPSVLLLPTTLPPLHVATSSLLDDFTILDDDKCTISSSLHSPGYESEEEKTAAGGGAGIYHGDIGDRHVEVEDKQVVEVVNKHVMAEDKHVTVEDKHVTAEDKHGIAADKHIIVQDRHILAEDLHAEANDHVGAEEVKHQPQQHVSYFCLGSLAATDQGIQSSSV